MYGYIYLIVNNLNGKTYVGQRKCSKDWKEDKYYMGSGKYLKCAKNKYGIENFEKYLLQICYTKEELDNAEIFWIAEYRSRGKAEYNILAGGSQRKDYRCTDETRKKISDALKGKPTWNKEVKTGIVTSTVYKKGHKCYWEGKTHTKEYKVNMSKTNKKRMETVKEAYKKSGRKDWNTFQKEFYKGDNK